MCVGLVAVDFGSVSEPSCGYYKGHATGDLCVLLDFPSLLLALLILFAIPKIKFS